MEAIKIIEKFLPVSGVWENVLGFKHWDCSDARSPMVYVMDEIISLGYAVRLFEVCASSWLPKSRPRQHVACAAEIFAWVCEELTVRCHKTLVEASWGILGLIDSGPLSRCMRLSLQADRLYLVFFKLSVQGKEKIEHESLHMVFCLLALVACKPHENL